LKTAFCTISTRSHRFKTRALFRSLRPYTEADFFALYTDHSLYEEDDKLYKPVQFEQIITKETAGLVKYNKDKRRWGSKPFLMLYLLNKGYDAVIYVDNDICFYASPDFLFNKLKKQSILLTPHYYPADPQRNQIWLEANFRVGLYNAGFIGASQKGMDALMWWGNCCLYNIKKAYCRGLFDDQKYLDAIPVFYDDVEIIKHRGCNVAAWNIETSIRSLNEKGELRLNRIWPLVFIHFNIYTIQAILSGKDSLLKPYLVQYTEVLQQEEPRYDPCKEVRNWKFYFKAYLNMFKFKVNRLFDAK
jgi:hypothetical protein